MGDREQRIDLPSSTTTRPRRHFHVISIISPPNTLLYSTSSVQQGRGCVQVTEDEFLSTTSEHAPLLRADRKFLAHPQPLMFVAGLTPSRDRSGSTAQPGSSSRRPSDASRHIASGSGSGSTYLDPSQSTALNSITPLTSPSARQAELPKSPPPLTSPGSGVLTPTAPVISKEEGKDERDRDFEKLVADLKGALESKSGSGKVWIPESERKDFRIMLVDKVCLAGYLDCVQGDRGKLTASISDYQLGRYPHPRRTRINQPHLTLPSHRSPPPRPHTPTA
jgi:hypothetical protein